MTAANPAVRTIDATAAAAAPDLATALAEAPYLPSRKLAGWTAPRQRQFLELIAMGETVEAAARWAQLSPQSAYAFRASPRGAVFALGWRAALLIARDRLADTLLARAFEGQKVVITRDDGSYVERHFHDNRLALATLTRLDRLADRTGGRSNGAAAPAPDAQAARLVAQDWEGFLDLVEAERGPARAALFLARRSGDDGSASLALEPIAALARADLRLRSGAGHPDEVAAADLDPAARAAWTADQWARAEAAGLVRLAAPDPAEPLARDGMAQPSQHSPGNDADLYPDADRDPVWWCEHNAAWRTRFPPPAGFLGEEGGDYGDPDYERALSDAEEAAQEAPYRADTDIRRVAEAEQRDAWFVAALEEAAAIAIEAADRRDAESDPAAREGDATSAGFQPLRSHHEQERCDA